MDPVRSSRQEKHAEWTVPQSQELSINNLDSGTLRREGITSGAINQEEMTSEKGAKVKVRREDGQLFGCGCILREKNQKEGKSLRPASIQHAPTKNQ